MRGPAPWRYERQPDDFVADGVAALDDAGFVAADDDGAADDVGDGSGAGPFLSAAATALFSADSDAVTVLPLTFTVGVPLMPIAWEWSVCAATSALCFSLMMHWSNVSAAVDLMPMAVP